MLIHLLSRERINLRSEQAREFNGLKNEYIQTLSDIIKDLIKTNTTQPFMLDMATDAVMGMLFNQAQWLNAELNRSQHNLVLKRFANGSLRP